MPNQDHILKHWEIRVTDKAGALKERFGKDRISGNPHLIEFDLERNGGCHKFDMELDKRAFGAMQIGYILEFWAETMNDAGVVNQALTRYWKGELMDIPAADTTSEVLHYTAVGLSNQLVKRHVLVYFAGADVDDIVASLVTGEISTDSDISSATDQISIATPYTAGDAQFEVIAADDALKLLAELQKDVDWGVDQNGKVYFKDTLTTVVDKAWIGTHIASYEPNHSGNELANQIIVMSKEAVGGGMLILRASDGTSISAYRRRTMVKKVPHLVNPNDAWRVAEFLRAQNKDPKLDIKVEALVNFTNFQFPRGKVEVRTAAGAVAQTLPIQRIIYRLDERGFRGSYEIGHSPEVELSREIKELLRRIEETSSSSISTIKIAYTRAKLAERNIMVDAGKQGNTNTFVDSFAGVKALNQDSSIHIANDNKREFLTSHMDHPTSTYYSNPIPLGRVPGTIRVYAEGDLEPKIDFRRDDDLTDFFTFEGGSTWRIKDGTHDINESGGATYLIYKTGAGFVIPTNSEYLIRCLLGTPSVAGSEHYLYGAWADATHWIRINMRNTASNYVFKLEYQDGGVVTTILTYNATKDAAYQVEIGIDFINDLGRLHVMTTAGADLYNQTAVIPQLTGPLSVRMRNWTDGSSNTIDWFQVKQLGTGSIAISRDGGTTFNTGGTISGSPKYNVNVSGQPSGDLAVLRCVIAAPARLYAWGISWKADA